jgi:hypothetical protein
MKRSATFARATIGGAVMALVLAGCGDNAHRNTSVDGVVLVPVKAASSADIATLRSADLVGPPMTTANAATMTAITRQLCDSSKSARDIALAGEPEVQAIPAQQMIVALCPGKLGHPVPDYSFGQTEPMPTVDPPAPGTNYDGTPYDAGAHGVGGTPPDPATAKICAGGIPAYEQWLDAATIAGDDTTAQMTALMAACPEVLPGLGPSPS